MAEESAQPDLRYCAALRREIQRTIARAHAAAEAARVHSGRSEQLLARAEHLVDDSRLLHEVSAALRAELAGGFRDAVARYARHVRDEGTPPERMLVLVKAAVREVTTSSVDAATARVLMEAAVRCSIDAYYDVA